MPARSSRMGAVLLPEAGNGAGGRARGALCSERWARRVTILLAMHLSGCGPTVCAPDPDTVYYLPFEPGTSSLVVQGNNGPFSHQNEYAIDFLMPLQTLILAARDGLVIDAEDTNTKSCWLTQDCRGNRVIIAHSDGTRARYWHLYPGSLRVAVGDQVRRGQVIATAGQTGIAVLPHLHFSVTDNANRSIEVRFAEICGNGGVPLTLHMYRSQNATQPSP